MRIGSLVITGLSTLLLCGCLSIPVTDDSSLMIEVLPPPQAGDVTRATAIVDAFSHRYGYSPLPGLNQEFQAGDAYVKGFGYSGALRTLRENGQSKNVPWSGEPLPYLVGLSEGTSGQLFFYLELRSRDSARDSLARQFVETIQSKFGKSRVRIAMPIVVSQLSIGD